VSSDGDPERLLAEALRAQAVQAPLPDPATDGEPRLLSGTDAHPELLSGRADTVGVPTYALEPATVHVTRRALSVWWIVVLAILLGLAAGAVVGLVSVL
jgi:hypothetical protein